VAGRPGVNLDFAVGRGAVGDHVEQRYSFPAGCDRSDRKYHHVRPRARRIDSPQCVRLRHCVFCIHLLCSLIHPADDPRPRTPMSEVRKACNKVTAGTCLPHYHFTRCILIKLSFDHGDSLVETSLHVNDIFVGVYTGHARRDRQSHIERPSSDRSRRPRPLSGWTDHPFRCGTVRPPRRSLEQHIYKLRSKLALDNRDGSQLKTVYSLGYVFVPREQEAAECREPVAA